MFELHSLVMGVDSNDHVVDDGAFFSGGDVGERGGPTFERFEAKREGVLSGLESWTLVDNRFIFGEHISCLIVGHLKISIT